jgi:hypothetical protein
MMNFPSPESDYALLPLVAVSLVTNLPLWAILLTKISVEKYKKVQEAKKNRKIDKQYNEKDKQLNEEQIVELKKSDKTKEKVQDDNSDLVNSNQTTQTPN